MPLKNIETGTSQDWLTHSGGVCFEICPATAEFLCRFDPEKIKVFVIITVEIFQNAIRANPRDLCQNFNPMTTANKVGPSCESC